MRGLPKFLERLLTVVAIGWVAGIVLATIGYTAFTVTVGGGQGVSVARGPGYPTIEVPVSFVDHQVLEVGALPPEKALDYVEVTATEGTASIPLPPGIGGTALGVLLAIIQTLPGLIIVLLLRSLFRSIAAGQPFTDKVVNTVAGIGVTMLAYYTLAAGVSIVGGILLSDLLMTNGLEVSTFAVDSGGLFISLVVLVLAQVFRYGAQLQADADATV